MGGLLPFLFGILTLLTVLSFWGSPVIAIVFFLKSLNQYRIACEHHKQSPESVPTEQKKLLRTQLIASAVILALVIIGFLVFSIWFVLAVPYVVLAVLLIIVFFAFCLSKFMMATKQRKTDPDSLSPEVYRTTMTLFVIAIALLSIVFVIGIVLIINIFDPISFM